MQDIFLHIFTLKYLIVDESGCVIHLHGQQRAAEDSLVAAAGVQPVNLM